MLSSWPLRAGRVRGGAALLFRLPASRDLLFQVSRQGWGLSRSIPAGGTDLFGRQVFGTREVGLREVSVLEVGARGVSILEVGVLEARTREVGARGVKISVALIHRCPVAHFSFGWTVEAVHHALEVGAGISIALDSSRPGAFRGWLGGSAGLNSIPEEMVGKQEREAGAGIGVALIGFPAEMDGRIEREVGAGRSVALIGWSEVTAHHALEVSIAESWSRYPFVDT